MGRDSDNSKQLSGATDVKLVWLFIFASVFIWSAINPHDRFTWLLEVLPAIIGLVVLAVTYNHFRLTRLAYLLVLVLAHCVNLMVGGHYSYAEVPLFDYLAEIIESGRNNYDKLGHFAQGLVPAILAREILIRKHVVANAHWRNFFILCFCLAFSAFYELIEWWVALISGEDAEALLGTQGYAWDTQSDMGMALLGSLLALTLLHKIHDGQLSGVGIADGEQPGSTKKNNL